MARKTKKQKRFESKHWMMYGYEFYQNLPKSIRSKQLRPTIFRMKRFRGLILGLIDRKKCDFLGHGKCFNRGISYDYGTNKIGINTSNF